MILHCFVWECQYTKCKACTYISSFLIVGSLVSVGVSRVDFHAQGGQLWNMSGIPTAMSFYILCFGGHPVLPSIYMSMRHRHQFIKVISLGMHLNSNLMSFIIICCLISWQLIWYMHILKVLMIRFLLTTTTCLIGYSCDWLSYVRRRSEISDNPQPPTSEAGAKIAIYSLLLMPITRYALIVTPVASAIEGLLPQNYFGRSLIQRAIRLVTLASNTLLAFFFPYFETLMGLLGSIFVVSASFLLPCACYIKLTPGFSTWSCKLVTTVAIIVFGVLVGILGTYTAIVDLVNH
ncbi:putative amino acid transporter, transmembrane domain-containing protein [Rosa chinensis]|uniref:Putative amino acid transporter, transmembrane domain-containing protein n=1 Tax=Rosa chinensis TaxID=74649 RepID=A0A2P6QGT9_ROSCH|nr:putative amino acid transporter, transmembrane domain-containing protein [Rosa chinensis]